MTTESSKPRAFVSSVIGGFESYRQAAKRGIEAADFEPVLINEEASASNSSSRNACLDGVDSCDVYLAIVGGRGGWRAPSGKLVVEEEYDRAREKKKYVLAFIETVERDKDAVALVQRLSDYVDGHFRASFTDEKSLEKEVARALASLAIRSRGKTLSTPKIFNELIKAEKFRDETVCRLIVVPERDEEIFDPLLFDDAGFVDEVQGLAHRKEIKLFDFSLPKTIEDSADTLQIEQDGRSRTARRNQTVRVHIKSNGAVVIDFNATGRRERTEGYDLGEGFTIAETDLAEVLVPALRFVGALYEFKDAYKRHQRFSYNVALTNLGSRKLVPKHEKKNSWSMNSGDDAAVVAFDSARTVTRADLLTPDEEVVRVLSMFRKRMKDKS